MCTVDEASKLCTLKLLNFVDNSCDPSNKAETCKPRLDPQQLQFYSDILGTLLQLAGSEDEQLQANILTAIYRKSLALLQVAGSEDEVVQALILTAIPIRDTLIALVRACGLA